MPKFRKKQVVIEAWQWSGKVDYRNPPPDWLPWVFAPMASEAATRACVEVGEIRRYENFLHIGTLEGVMACAPNDWIIRGIKGELYPCKPDIFAATYEAVDPVDLPFVEEATRG